MNFKSQPWKAEFGLVISPSNSADKDILKFDSKLAIELLYKHRALIFRGFDNNIDIFKKFTEIISTDFLKHLAGYRKPVGGDNTVTEVVPGTAEVLLHGEMYYQPEVYRPDLLSFSCVTAPEQAGETTLADGIKFWEELPTDLKELFTKKKICYIFNMPVLEAQKYCGADSLESCLSSIREMGYQSVSFNGENKRVNFELVTPAFVETRFQKRAFLNNIANWLLQKREFFGGREIDKNPNDRLLNVVFEDRSEITLPLLEKINQIGEAISEPVKWENGDLVLVDNKSILHGRRSFSGKRYILSRFSFIKDQH